MKLKPIRVALAIFAVVLGNVSAVAASNPVGASTSTHPITWLAAGDSYSSDIGLPHTTKICARAVAPSEDWATYTWTKLSSRLDVIKPELVACAGAKTEEFFGNQDKKHRKEYPGRLGGHGPRFDLVTFTFGGNDIGFADVATACFLAGLGEGSCNDTKVRRNITALGQAYPNFLVDIANNALVNGGNIVVMGYPELLEDPTLWSKSSKALGLCNNFSVAETNAMRGWAGDLNAAIGSAVRTANAFPAASRNDVTFTFIDPVSGGNNGISRQDPNLFEPSSGPRHELCSPSGRAWLNGIRLNHLKTQDFHPNQYGEDAMGALADEVIPHLSWPWSQPATGTVGSAAQSTLPVKVCSTTFGGGGQGSPQPTSITARTSLAGLPPMTAYTDSEGISEVIAPTGWGCSAFIGADSTTGISVWPPGASAPAQDSTLTEGIEAFVYPGANIGGQYDLVCGLFPSAGGQIGEAQGPCPANVPSGETDTMLKSDVVAFDDPPGVNGSWNNSSGAYSANGVMVYDYGGQVANTTTEQAGCLLPDSEKDVCTASLDDFINHYAHPIAGATNPPPSTTQPTTGTTGNTGAAPQASNTGTTGNTG